MAAHIGSESVPEPTERFDWLAGARLVDLERGVVTEPSSILIRSGRIAEILVGSPPRGSKNVLRTEGLYLLPGLITCHVHLQATYPYSQRDPREVPEVTARRAAQHAARLPITGIAAVRTVHEQSQADLRVRREVALHGPLIPRIVAGGRALTAPLGHGDGLGAVVAQGCEGFYRAALEELKDGADHVKIFASGGLARAGEALDKSELSIGEMAGAVQAATEHGTYVVAHSATSSSIRLGLEAGVRSFEHAYVIDAVTAREIASAGAYLTPTLVVTDAFDWMTTAGFAPDAIDRSRRMRQRHLESISMAVEAGVAIVHGTDFPPEAISNGTSLLVRELELMVAAGLSHLDSLRSATVTAARLLGISNQAGHIGIGRSADFVGVSDNPLHTVSTLRTIKLTVLAGQLVRAPAGGT